MPPKKGTREYDRWENSPTYEEFCRKQSERIHETPPSFKGHRHSDESRKQMSDAHLGNNGRLGTHHSYETRQILSEKNLGKHPTKETRRLLSEIRRGKKRKPFSDAHLHNLSVSQLGKRCGKLNPSWKGGISFKPYPMTFNAAFKRPVREHYGNVCINCGKTPEENERELTCHHYDYDKNSKNCVPACLSCNSIANGSNDNGSRAFWEDWYTEILNEFFTKI